MVKDPVRVTPERDDRRSTRRTFFLLSVALVAMGGGGWYWLHLNQPHPNPIFERIRWCDSAKLTARNLQSSLREESTFVIEDMKPLEHLAFMGPGGDFASRGGMWERVDFVRNSKEVAGAYFTFEADRIHAIFFDGWDEDFQGELTNQSARRLLLWLVAHGNKSYRETLARACDRRVRAAEVRARVLEICPELDRAIRNDHAAFKVRKITPIQTARIVNVVQSHPKAWGDSVNRLLKLLREVWLRHWDSAAAALPVLDPDHAALLLFGSIGSPELRERIPDTAYRRAIQRILRSCNARYLSAALGPLSRENPKRVADIVKSELAGRLNKIRRLDGRAEHSLVIGTLAWARTGHAPVEAIRTQIKAVDEDHQSIFELIVLAADDRPEQLQSHHLAHRITWRLAQPLLERRSTEDRLRILHGAFHANERLEGPGIFKLYIKITNSIALLTGTDHHRTLIKHIPMEPFVSCPKCSEGRN